MSRDAAIKLLVVWIAVPILALASTWFAIRILSFDAGLRPELGLNILAVSAAIFGVVGLMTTNAIMGGAANARRRGGAGAKTWHYIVLGGLPIAIVAVGVSLYVAMIGQAPIAESTLGVLLVIGVIALLTAITVATVFFHGLSLSDPNEALGMPKGSVRAIIALALILIFAIMSIYLYSQVEDTNAAASADIAKQLVTTVSTLVVAVSAFYFGASSVQAATSSVAAAMGRRGLTVTGPSPLPKLRGASGGPWDPESISIQTVTSPPGLAVNASVVGDRAATLTPETGGFRYAPDQAVDRVLLRFALADDSTVTQEILLEVEAPAGGGAGEDEGLEPQDESLAAEDVTLAPTPDPSPSPFDRSPGAG